MPCLSMALESESFEFKEVPTYEAIQPAWGNYGRSVMRGLSSGS